MTPQVRRTDSGNILDGVIAALVCTVLSASCGGATEPPAGAIAQPVSQSTLELTCLPGHFTGALSDATETCPPAGKPWRVYKHRSAVAKAGEPDRPPPPATLIAATCSYVWTGAGAGDQSTLPGLPAIFLRPLCVEQPPLPASLREESCPAGLQLALRAPTRDACTPAAGWDARPLFPGKDGELGRYCQYTARGPAPAADRDDGLVPILSDVDAPLPSGAHGDCAVIGTLGTSTQQQQMEDAFYQAVERLPTLPLVAGGAQPQRVRVAVVDSALDRRDDGLPGVGQATHGRTMGVIAARLGCPQRNGASACAVDVQNEPALWLDKTPQGWARNPRGGSVGTQADLAAALVAAVDATPAGEPLVVNISLGWSPDFGGSQIQATDFPLPVQAVFIAIQYARCRGAVVIASAGNATGSPATPLGPLLPGAWETRMAPTLARCLELGVASPAPPAPGRPLLYAAGSVDDLDRPLFNTPLLGRPRLAAPASNAAVEDPAPSAVKPHGAFTGSSVAAVVTSAAVAVAWSYLPLQPGDAIVDGVYDSAVDLRLAANFCNGGPPCPSIRRVSICRAAQAACADAAALCDSVPGCATDGARTAPADLPDLAAMHAGSCSLPTSRTVCLPATPRVRDAWQLPLIERQPAVPVCTVCGISTGNWLLGLDTNPDNSAFLFTTDAVALWDTLGSLTIGTASNPALQFHGGADLSSGIDLSLMAPPVSWARADFSYLSFNGFFGISRIVESQWLYVTP